MSWMYILPTSAARPYSKNFQHAHNQLTHMHIISTTIILYQVTKGKTNLGKSIHSSIRSRTALLKSQQ